MHFLRCKIFLRLPWAQGVSGTRIPGRNQRNPGAVRLERPAELMPRLPPIMADADKFWFLLTRTSTPLSSRSQTAAVRTWQHCLRGIHPRARQAHQASEPRRYPLGWGGPRAAELRADEEASRDVEGNTPSGRYCEAGRLPGLHRGRVRCPQHLARRVHDLYFNPRVEEFAARTTWSLSNAFTSAFKDLDPIPQFKATAKLASFL
jgi:hypothetical protein